MVMDAGGRILVSDAEREAVVARLNAAAVEGRLTLDEFGDRTTRAYASRTRADLVAVLDGLPFPHLPPPVGAPPPYPGPGPYAGPPPYPGPPPPAGFPYVGPVTPPLVVVPPSTNLPMISMIVGIVSASVGMFAFLSGPAGIAAVVLGIIGLREVRRGKSGSRGMAIAGIATGWLGIVAQAGMLVLLFGIGINR